MKAKQSVSWREMPQPSSSRDRIDYLNACQSFLTEMPAAACPSSRLLVVDTEQAIHTESRCIAQPRPRTVGASAVFTCAVCSAESRVHDLAPLLANPFSNWMVLQCQLCAATYRG